MVDHIRYLFRVRGASRGQIIIMVALFAVVLTGMVGMATDIGYAMAEKRSVQNAADAGAIAGAHALTLWDATTNPNEKASTDVSAVVDANKMNSSTTQTFTCAYVDDTDAKVGNCSTVVPSNATGVQVTVEETHKTFFMRVFPFAPQTVSTSGRATAHVQAVTDGVGSDSPFIVCGNGTHVADGTQYSILTQSADATPAEQQVVSNLTYPVASGSQYQVQLLNNGNGNGNNNSTPTPTPTGTATSGGSGNWHIDSGAYKKTYVIHSPGVADCGLKANDFKGLAANMDNYGMSIPGLFDWTNGDRAGPTRVKVAGINGCGKDETAKQIDNCVMIVPIASDSTSNGQLDVQLVGAFQVSSCSPSGNCHEGKLLEKYDIRVDGQGKWTGSNGWKVGDDGLVTIRLTS